MKLPKFISDKITSWQLTRSPRAKSVSLTHRNTYIFPTRYGFLLLATILLMGIGATNYQNNLVFVATFVVITLGLLAVVLTFSNLVNLKVSAHSPEPVFSGQSAQVHLTVQSEKDHYAVSMGDKEHGMHTLDVLANSENPLSLSFLFNQRGIHRIPSIRCQTLYPFGFLQAWSWLFFDVYCVVYPKPLEPEHGYASEQLEGDEYDDKFKGGFEDFYGLKAYQKGDLMSRIHWKSYARGKGLQTKVFVDYQSEPDIFDFDAFSSVDTERRLSYLCFLVVTANESGGYFGLKLKENIIPADFGEEHMHRCLKALAEFKL